MKQTEGWKTIREKARQEASKLGHHVGPFDGRKQVRVAMCEKCYGCCWVSQYAAGVVQAGGRILRYKCGTKEAMGVL